jgi:TRAP-type uncharacterized transport system substrate-binding protein
MLRWLLMSIVALPLAVCPVAALAADLGVITGSEKGTYYQSGLNFQALGKPNGINVNVLPYNEEVHLLARKGTASFDDLATKRVAIGREGSGTRPAPS